MKGVTTFHRLTFPQNPSDCLKAKKAEVQKAIDHFNEVVSEHEADVRPWFDMHAEDFYEDNGLWMRDWGTQWGQNAIPELEGLQKQYTALLAALQTCKCPNDNLDKTIKKIGDQLDETERRLKA